MSSFGNFIKELEKLGAELNDAVNTSVKPDHEFSPEIVRRSMTPEERARLEMLREKQRARKETASASDEHKSKQGSMADFVETENIEFHEDGHSSGVVLKDAVQPAYKISARPSMFTPQTARLGFVYSEILGKPLALRRRRR